MKKTIKVVLIVLLVLLSIWTVACDKKADENDIYSIYVSKEPDKINYYAGESLDITGCEITVQTRSRNDYVVKVTPSMVSGFSSALGNHTLIITYIVGNTSFSTKQIITVTTRVAYSAVIKEYPIKTTFIEGERIDLSGLIAEVTFSDKTVADRHIGAFTLNKTIAEMGMEEVELRLDKVTLRVPITVIAKKISGLKATSLPKKTVYNEGEFFEPNGLEVYAVYNDGSIGYFVEYEVENGDKPLSATQNTVRVCDKYAKGLTLDIPITINAVEISSVELIDKDKIQTVYMQGCSLDLSKIRAKIVFSDGSEKIVDRESLNFDMTEDKPLTKGEYTLNIEYKYASKNPKSDSIKIIVIEEKLPIGLRVETNGNFMGDYIDKEDIGLSGISVYVLYNDGTEEWIIYENQINEEIEGFTMSETADIDNPFIEFRLGEIVEQLEISVRTE